jgi:hypothetical protein
LAVYHTGTANNKGITASGSTPTTWSQTTLPASDAWIDVAVDSSNFYILAEFGSFYSSSNGTTWTAKTNPGNYLINLKYLGSTLFAMDDRFAGNNKRSSNLGTTWTTIDSLSRFGDIDYSGTKYIISGPGGTGLTSTNGTTFTQFTQPGPYSNIVYGNGRWLMYNHTENSSNYAVSTNDGTSWTTYNWGAGPWMNIVFYKNLFWRFVTDSATAYASSDLISWTSFTLPVALNSMCVGIGNNRIILLGNKSTTAIISPVL